MTSEQTVLEPQACKSRATDSCYYVHIHKTTNRSYHYQNVCKMSHVNKFICCMVLRKPQKHSALCDSEDWRADVKEETRQVTDGYRHVLNL